MAREPDVSLSLDHALDQARDQASGTDDPATSPGPEPAPEIYPESARHFERPEREAATGGGEGASMTAQNFENGPSRRLSPVELEAETQRRSAELRAARRRSRQRRRPTIEDFLREDRDRYDFEE